MSKQPSLFGGACIIASVCVGAGMLGTPQCRCRSMDSLVDAGAHFNHGSHDAFRMDVA